MESWLRFANLQVPARLGNALLDRFGTPDAVFAASLSELSAIPGLSEKQALRLADPTCIPTTAQLGFAEQAQVAAIPRDSAEYPRNLKEIPDPPPVLFVRGKLLERDRFAVGIVGSRHASPYGRSVTARLARDLSHAGLTVV